MEAAISEKLFSEVQAVEEDDSEVNFKDKLWNETKKMWVIAAPAMFTKFSTFGVTVISHSFVGHIGSNELAAYALVSTVLLRIGNGILDAKKLGKVLHVWHSRIFDQSSTAICPHGVLGLVPVYLKHRVDPIKRKMLHTSLSAYIAK
ncbi:hypothetical protein RND71_004229 [Anisodus tanguticus]|uniref:Uncharacterized protein n=1 Tax=Anisodus tanguticus TaxID=243964 RepID=A0AAE1VPG0_9SOLA|nr:hypothetical protein RND71_004229 [Anisodus tanguticus]